MPGTQGDINETVPVGNAVLTGSPGKTDSLWEALDPLEQPEVGIQL